MQVKIPGWKWASCSVLLVGGCGAIPEFMVDAARASAKEAIEQSVHDLVGESLDFDNLFLPFGGEFDLNDLLDLEDVLPPFDDADDNEDELNGEEPEFEEDGQDTEQPAGRR